MRQIQNMPSTPVCRNTFTCGFSTRKGRCARGFRNLPHTSDGRFRKCWEKPRSTDQTPILRFRDLRFCCQISGYARRFPIFPALPENTATPSVPKRKPLRIPPAKQPIKRKNRLSAVSADQAGRTVARPHHSWHFKEKPDLSQSLTGKPQRIKAEQQCVSKVACEQKNARNYVFSQLGCKF